MNLHAEELIRTAAAVGASDLHLVYGLPVKCRIDGRLRDLSDHSGDPEGVRWSEERLDDEALNRIARELAGDAYDGIRKNGELDLSATIGGRRIRGNLFCQQGHLSAAIRLLSSSIPDLKALNLPPAVREFSSYNKGIVLVTGETGSGKSTTLAAILNEINKSREEHIITLEDPIEYIYTPDKCVINQREIGKDTVSYAAGLKAALREDPDVILIGELRDAETIDTALTAAETGHLVFATLHTNSAVDSIDRIVSVFPADRQAQVRLQLSAVLRAVLSQQLLPRCDGNGRVAACECMIVVPALQNLIREGKTHQMSSYMTAATGSILMDNCLTDMVMNRIIDRKTALNAAFDREKLEKKI